MNVLLPVLIAVLLGETGSKAQALVRGAGASTPHGRILVALMFASVLSYSIGAIGGVLIGRMLAEEARLLLAALALALAGGPMLLRATPVRLLESEAGLAKLTAKFIVAQFGDGAQFIVFAFTAYVASPAIALLGGLLGVMAAGGAALMVDQFALKLVSLRVVRVAAGLLLLLFGAVLAINALGIG